MQSIPEEVEEIEGKTVADNTARISRDEQGNITDLAISTEIEKIKNGFSLTSEAKTVEIYFHHKCERSVK